MNSRSLVATTKGSKAALSGLRRDITMTKKRQSVLLGKTVKKASEMKFYVEEMGKLKSLVSVLRTVVPWQSIKGVVDDDDSDEEKAKKLMAMLSRCAADTEKEAKELVAHAERDVASLQERVEQAEHALVEFERNVLAKLGPPRVAWTIENSRKRMDKEE